MKEEIITLKDVWKTYRMGDVEVHALRGLNLSIKKGEFVSIQGPSGSGKSTAMNMVGALDLPTKGKIYLDNKDISTMSESDLAQIRGKKIGFIFQQFNLIPTMSALENVALPMMFQGASKEKREKRAKELLEMVELGERLDHKPYEMSGGQQQRVAIARSLVNEPEVILADEPTGNLDSKTSNIVMEFLKDLHKNKKTTIIMVTHDPDTAKFAERVESLHDGQIIKTRRKKK
ncbi:MAG: ABC transporter ATP-binding protein [Candidatus Woesearchaeota archaeon]